MVVYYLFGNVRIVHIVIMSMLYIFVGTIIDIIIIFLIPNIMPFLTLEYISKHFEVGYSLYLIILYCLVGLIRLTDFKIIQVSKY